MIKIVGLFTLLLCGVAQAESSSFYDRNGSFAGSAVRTKDGKSSFTDRNGSFAGSAIRHGNSVSTYDRNGHFTGSVIQRK